MQWDARYRQNFTPKIWLEWASIHFTSLVCTLYHCLNTETCQLDSFSNFLENAAKVAKRNSRNKFKFIIMAYNKINLSTAVDRQILRKVQCHIYGYVPYSSFHTSRHIACTLYRHWELRIFISVHNSCVGNVKCKCIRFGYRTNTHRLFELVTDSSIAGSTCASVTSSPHKDTRRRHITTHEDTGRQNQQQTKEGAAMTTILRQRDQKTSTVLKTNSKESLNYVQKLDHLYHSSLFSEFMFLSGHGYLLQTLTSDPKNFQYFQN